ncbi:MAG: hypothetical protein EOO45_14040 [Flavobacterium sp.]|nr:MAG: hypothetical protein EOO45_14040 [Flavobacterium sp.]
MAVELTIYSIYKLTGKGSYFLLRTLRPGYSNVSQIEEDIAVSAEQTSRERMLKQISPAGFELIGELQNYPVGDTLFSVEAKSEVDIYYMETGFGHPWVVLGTASSEEEFLSELEDDEDLMRLKPVGSPIKITATFFTENDFRF